MVASRPVPMDSRDTFFGALTHALWHLHHEVSLQNPKTGEMVAFRRVVPSIPEGVGADEDWIRDLVEQKGYRVLYEPRALVYNTGPKTLDEFMRQRVRVNVQEMLHSRRSAFVAPTRRTGLLVNALFAYLRGGQADLRALLVLSVLEGMAKAYSRVRVTVNPVDLSVWDRLPSTKSLPPEEEGEFEHSAD